MRRGTLPLLFFIILLALGALFVVFWPNTSSAHPKFLPGLNNPFTFKEGLDLQGGVRVLLVPKAGQKYTDSDIEATRALIETRVNSGLGVNEPSIRTQKSNGVSAIAVELPGLNNGNRDQQIQQLFQAGTLEFWITGPQSTGTLQPGTAFDPSQYTQYNPGGKAPFTGKDLDSSQLAVQQDPTSGAYEVGFEMKSNKLGDFSSFTQKNVGNVMTVTLDRQVIQSPVINSAITGPGVIQGQFTQESAQSIVNLLKSGALPIALDIQSQETVDATLGQDSITRSVIAGAIGLGMVILFMLLYYRLPGFLAAIALVLYGTITMAVFKLLGVVLSLAGITGFILSIGMAVDANVLIFERVKEELRAGRLLSSAIDIGWKRAWPSIRDSNTSTIITCCVLYFFGSNFGASIIVGFATTLILGVVISMFTAIVVTRTFLNLLVPTGVINHPALFGLPSDAIPSARLAQRNSAV